MKLHTKYLTRLLTIAFFCVALCLLPQPANLAIKPSAMTPANNVAMMFESHIRTIYNNMDLANKGLNYNTFKYALIGYYNINPDRDFLTGRTKVAICDFRQPSSQKRLFVIDLASQSLLFHTYVAHGKNSGLVYAQTFSNAPSSLQSSLGFYRTEDVYYGSNGYSLRLEGLDRGFNDRAKERAIVMHGAAYVDEGYIQKTGKAGRSWGCPAVPLELCHDIIDQLRWGNYVFVYTDDANYLNNSTYINLHKAATAYAKKEGLSIN